MATVPPPATVIEITRADLDELVEAAAERGAAKALKTLGLEDEKAPHDIRDLRELLRAWKDVKSESLKTASKIITTALLGAIAIGLAFQFGIKNLFTGGS